VSYPGLQIEGVFAYFPHLKCQKIIFWGDNNFWGDNDPQIRFIHLIMQECLKMYLITLNVFKICL
jgi:hypothetical protein